MTADRVAALREVGSRQGSSHATQEEFVARYRLRPAGTSAAPAIIRHLGRNSARQFPDGGWRHKFDRNAYVTRVFAEVKAPMRRPCTRWDRQTS